MPGEIDKGESKSIRRRDILPEDKLPPKLSKWDRFLLCLARAAMVVAVLCIAYICFAILRGPNTVPECVFCTYLALAGFLSGLVSEFFIRHKARVHESRKEDRSEIEALIQEAKNIQPRLTEPEMPAGFGEKRQQIQKEVQRLEDVVGPEGWTEFQVLTLDRMLIDFLSLEDLKARARTSLNELKEYAYGEAFSYDVRLYYDWEDTIKSNIDSLDALDKDDESAKTKDDKAEALRANLRSLREHVADYQAKWAEGSTIVSGIRICGSAAVVVFTLMGILPTLWPVQNSTPELNLQLGILNWSFLGVAGAIISVLIGLRNAKEVEVGDTSGRQELSRAVLGTTLGLIAGILVFSALAGGMIKSGGVIPNLAMPELSDVYLSIVWAVGAGMGFERVFQRVRGTVES